MEAVKCEAFLAAAELGSLTATAELLGYTQSGVTRMIGTLEEELGFPLFLRSKKGVQLTENGKLMLPLLREVFKWGREANPSQPLSSPLKGLAADRLLLQHFGPVDARDPDGVPRPLSGRDRAHAGGRQPRDGALAERALGRLLLRRADARRQVRLAACLS